MAEPSTTIRPQIGAFDLGMIVICLVIVIGIFRTPAIVARQAGSPEIFFRPVTTLASLWLLDTFEQIVNYVMSVDSIALASAAATPFVFRKKAGPDDPHQGFKVMGYPWLPAFFVLFLLIIAVNVIITAPSSALIGWALFVGGAPLYYVLQRVGK